MIILHMIELRSFSSSLGNFGDKSADFWKTGPVLSAFLEIKNYIL